MTFFNNTFLLRFALAVIMATHSIPSFLTMSVVEFGNWRSTVFGIFGVPLAFAVKGIHLLSVPALLMDKYLKPLALLNIVVLVAGIVMLHGREGWFVVGGGRNGAEYNFLLIFCFLTFVFPKGFAKY